MNARYIEVEPARITDAWELLRELSKTAWRLYEPREDGTFLFVKLFADPDEFPAELTELQAAHGGSLAIRPSQHPLGEEVGTIIVLGPRKLGNTIRSDRERIAEIIERDVSSTARILRALLDAPSLAALDSPDGRRVLDAIGATLAAIDELASELRG